MGISEKEAGRLPNRELSGEFARSKGKDRVAGTEIMRRVVGLSGLNPNEWLSKPLKGRDGRAVTDQDGAAVSVEGYLTDVAGNHPGAVKGILTFLNANASAPNFGSERSAMADMIRERT